MLTIRVCFAEMQREREELLNNLAGWPEEALRLQHGPRAWCALELMDHLARVERSAAAIVRLHRSEHRTLAWYDPVKRAALFTIMRSSLRVSVPKSSQSLLPTLPESFSKATAEWLMASREVADVMTHLGDDRRAVFFHPVGGWMTAAVAANFLQLHLLHHRGQWVRLRQNAFAA